MQRLNKRQPYYAFGVELAFLGVLISGAYMAFVVLALVSIVRSTNYTAGLKALWFLAVIAFPFLGSLLWFLVGRNSSG